MRHSIQRLVSRRSVCGWKRLRMPATKGDLRQYLAAFCGSLSIFCSAVAFSWVTPLLVRLTTAGPARSEPLLTADQSSWVVALIEVGNLLTPLPAGFLVDRLGRKPVLLACGPLYLATWVLVLTVRSIEALYVMRILQGAAMGFVLTVLPMYLGEIAGPKIRGSLSIFFQAMWYLGVLYVVSIAPFLTYDQIAWLCLAPCIVYMAAFVWLPESPYFLLMRGRQKEAGESLAWLRGAADVADVDKELSGIRESVESESRRKATWRDVLGTRLGRRCLLMANVVAATESLSGASPVISYATQTLSATQGGPLSAEAATVAVALGPLAVSALTWALVDRTGRRPVLLASATAATASLLAAALFYTFFDASTPPPPSLAWIPAASIVSYITLISFGIGPLVPILQSELFPNSTRGVASAITTLNLTLTSFLGLKLYQVFQDAVGLYVNYYIFAFFSFLGTICIFFLIPETKGKTFAEIQVMIDNQM